MATSTQRPEDRKAGRRVRVLLPLPLESAYDYRLPPELAAGPGSFVEVPLGGRVSLGVVWDELE
ncbi:MAG: primosome assembly protein PriA, partial [Rubritepida sp.]|nr:primosome assembly protein PriA [Rubritepida sp.]